MRLPPGPLCLLLLALSPACITPPAVVKAGDKVIPLALLPPGTEVVTVGVERDTISGVFVPAEPGAPVAVHLLGSGGSVTGSYMTDFLWAMRDRGLASLALDYRGVGPSGGSRSPDHLRADAHAAFAEALRRAGSEDRVVVRGTSLGTLAAASLLEDGDHPAAVVLFAPVRGETVAKNWLYENWWDVFAFPVSLLARHTSDVHLVPALEACREPLLVFFPRKDVFLPPDETELVANAVKAAGGSVVRDAAGTHLGVAALSFGVPARESELYEKLFPGLPDVPARVAEATAGVPEGVLDDASRHALEAIVARWRLDPPALAAALAVAGEERPDAYVVDWLRGFPRGRLDGLPFGALAALVDFRDPAGPLEPRELFGMKLAVQAEFAGRTPSPEEIEELARKGGWGRRANYETPLPKGMEEFSVFATSSQTVVPGEDPPKDAPARLRLPEEESLRQADRLMLKAAGIPDRVTPGGGLEAYVDGGWRAVDAAPATPCSASPQRSR